MLAAATDGKPRTLAAILAENCGNLKLLIMKKIFFLTLLLFSITISYSCTCGEMPSIKDNWEGANEVFIGKIIKVDSLHYGNNGAKIFSYTVKILKSFKEEFYNTRELRTIIGQDGGSCDFIFNLGEEYLIYAKSESQTLACSLCSRTRSIKKIENEEFKELERLHKEYSSNTSLVSTIRFENNISYQVELVKRPLEKKIKKQNMVIVFLSMSVIILFALILILRKRKN